MKPSLRRAFQVVPLAIPVLAALLALSACGGGDPTPTLAPGAPTHTPVPPSTPVVGTPTPTLVPTATPDAPVVDSGPVERGTGDVDGVVFVVSEGSKATFAVDEELASGTLPGYEAVMQTIGLTGEVRLDGGPSTGVDRPPQHDERSRVPRPLRPHPYVPERPLRDDHVR